MPLTPSFLHAAPAADVSDDYRTDPRKSTRWLLRGTWGWDGTGQRFLSSGIGTTVALWRGADQYTGTVSAQIRLMTGKPPRASIIFAYDTRTGAYRYLSITGGSSGSITLGQVGTIRGLSGRTFKTVRRSIPLNTWLKVTLVTTGDGSVTVSLGTLRLFTAAAGPLAGGYVGVSAAASKVGFDNFTYRAAPDAEPCRDCHAGQSGQPYAANVYRYWDGKWWDANRGGSATVQQGGHGDPGGKPALTCTGTTGCHDMRQPSLAYHRNGVREDRKRPSLNSFHMRAGFVNTSPVRPGDVQASFDTTCLTKCHQAKGVQPCVRHSRDDEFVQLGNMGTNATADRIPASMPIDADLTYRTPATPPHFAPCVTCHNPHGAETATTTNGSNHMVRLPWKSPSTLCTTCH